MTVRKIQATKNYRLFKRSDENRPLERKRHKKLFESMQTYGFLPCFPIICFRNGNDDLIVKDGQHRLDIAEELNLTVHWVEETIDFDVAVINCTANTWVLRDYALKFSKNGKQSYQEGLDFAEQHHLPVGTAFALLGGTTSFGNVQESFVSGKFAIKDRGWAEAVAGIYGPLVHMSQEVKNARFIEACMAVCRVPGFEPKRLLQGAASCRDRLVAYSTRDAYLDMLESIYNFKRSKLVGLKAAAVMAMRERNVTGANKRKRDDAA